jgi:hypothetical protein
MSASIILCADAKEQTEKRNAYKKFAKGNGTFVKVDRNTVVLKGGDSVSFVIEDVPKMDEEPILYGGSTSGGMAASAFVGAVYGRSVDTPLTVEDIRKAVRDMME